LSFRVPATVPLTSYGPSRRQTNHPGTSRGRKPRVLDPNRLRHLRSSVQNRRLLMHHPFSPTLPRFRQKCRFGPIVSSTLFCTNASPP
jgi:hypothetical protein